MNRFRGPVVAALLAALTACASGGGRSSSSSSCTESKPPALLDVLPDTTALRARFAEIAPDEPSGEPLTFTVRHHQDEALVIPRGGGKLAPAVRNALGAAVEASLAQPFDEAVAYRLVVSSDGMAARPVDVCRPIMLNRDEVGAALNRAHRQLGRSGTVVIDIRSDTTGAAADVQVWQSSGDSEIDAVALGIGYIARFRPATVDGMPVSTWNRFPITIVAR